MKVNILKLSADDLPNKLRFVEPPVRSLYWAGANPDEIFSKPSVAIVGSRKATPYGRAVAHELGTKLSRAGVVIISGLAFGIDSYAHEAALDSDGCTVAVLPTPIERVSPAAHHHLAQRIARSGGAIASEYELSSEIHKLNFIVRNRIVSGLADVLVIIEAAKNSGSLHTARFALEQGKTVMAVPGNINSPASEGCNNLIKSGAVPITDVTDIFFALKINPATQPKIIIKGTPEQRQIFELIASGISLQEELVIASQLAAHEINSILTILELQGYIRPLGGGSWAIA